MEAGGIEIVVNVMNKHIDNVYASVNEFTALFFMIADNGKCWIT